MGTIVERMAKKGDSPRVGETYLVFVLKTEKEYVGTVTKIARMRTGAVLAELQLKDSGAKMWIPVSKYAEWYKC
jgi:hypothetical protein